MIEVDNLCVYYGDRVVLDRLNFQVPPGKITVLLGRNGAGKSTLIKTLAGVHEKYSGVIRIDGIPAAEMPSFERAKKVAVVLTEYPKMPLTVEEIVASGRVPFANRFFRLDEEDQQSIRRVTEKLSLTPFMSRMFSTLSDGEKQRVMIARALVQESPVLLLDEPASHLDLPAMAEIFARLKSIARDGKTVLFSTHRFDFIFDLADYLILLDNGKAYAGTPDEILGSGKFRQVFSGDFLIFDERNKIFKLNIPDD